jgi:hypothetical protein
MYAQELLAMVVCQDIQSSVKEVHFHRGRHSLGKISPGSVNGI